MTLLLTNSRFRIIDSIWQGDNKSVEGEVGSVSIEGLGSAHYRASHYNPQSPISAM
jgi:hypothetical protein